jgi:gamma-glutamyltranspeptidase/glutathione hydrolase
MAALILGAASIVMGNSPVDLYGRAANGPNGVVASAKPQASQVGIDILKKGGNAVDAAVATAFALGVLEPNASGIGGGGFMIVKMAKMPEAVVIDFREVAPGKSTPTMYKLNDKGDPLDNCTTIGGLASGVPGQVKGLLYCFDHYGSKKISRAQVLQPAVDWATKGFTVTPTFVEITKEEFDRMKPYPYLSSLYLKDGLPHDVGDTIRNPELAKTYTMIAKHGADYIYKGAVAKAIAAEVQKQGGIITEEDLANYQVKIRKPVQGTYRGYTIMSIPPASSGGTHLIELLNILENFDMKGAGYGTALSAHLWTEAERLVFADRAKFMADTDFVPVPLKGLTSKAYAKTLAAQISTDKIMPSVAAGSPDRYESGSTTHLSVMDKAGNMVAITQTINDFFGSGVAIPGYGFIMNDEMDDFNPEPGTANSVQPGKRPLSSMSPSLVLDPQGRPFMVVGTPGGPRIFSSTAQVISNVIDHGMPIQEAINAPRVFRTHKSNLFLEGRVSLNTSEALAKMGHKTSVKGDWDLFFGGAQGVVYDYAHKILMGGADPRRDGHAASF